jgi:hypothetical protein
LKNLEHHYSSEVKIKLVLVRGNSVSSNVRTKLGDSLSATRSSSLRIGEKNVGLSRRNLLEWSVRTKVGESLGTVLLESSLSKDYFTIGTRLGLSLGISLA